MRTAGWFVVWGLLLVTWACGIGRYGGPDEPAHVLRAHAVAHGDVLGAPADPLPSGYRAVVVPRSIGTGDPACYRHDSSLTSGCARPDGLDGPGGLGGTIGVATSAGVNPPLYYALVGVPPRLAGVSDQVVAYRLAAVGWVALVLALACVRLRPFGRAAVVALAAITPSAWYLFGVVNPNGLEVALVGLAWVEVARRLHSMPTRSSMPTRPWAASVAWIAVPLTIAVAMRPIAFVAAITIGLVLESERSIDRRGRIALWAPIAVATMSVLVWQRVVRWDGTDPRTATDTAPWRSMLEAVGGLPRSAGELLGTLGWLEFTAPAIARMAWLVVAGVVVWLVARGPGRLRSRTVGLWFGSLVAVPVVFEVAAADRIGPIWQGRYSLPVFVGGAALAVASGCRPGRRATPAIVALAALAEATTYVATVRRFSVGTSGSWLLDGAEHTTAGFAPRTWVVIHLALVLALVVWALLQLQHVPEHVDDDVGGAGVVEHVEASVGTELQVGLVGHGHAGSGVRHRGGRSAEA